MDIQAKAEQLGKLKADLKALTGAVKLVQEELLAEGVASDLHTKHGKLAFTVRENYKVNNQPELIKFMGQKAFNNHASITKKGVQDAIGSQGVQDAMDKNLIAIKSVSEYFTLK